MLSSTIERTRAQFGRRYRQVRTLWKAEGPGGLSARVRRAAAEWLAPKTGVLPVRRADVLAADLCRPVRPDRLSLSPEQRIVVNWVTTPGSPGSGGHTTLFRLVRYLEDHGYLNRVYLYDVYGGDHRYYKEIVRTYYNFHGPVASADDGMEDAHIVIATGWPTAYAVFNSGCTGKRYYLIQDFEPYFYPVGTISSLAENTYRMGFHGLTIGRCFADRLRSGYGMTVETFEYGCETSRYRRVPNSTRSGVVFYARRETARRGFELGLMALELFASRRPDVPIHIYGDKIGSLPFRFIDHGRLRPDELSKIYNQCYAGISLSYTNVSLTAREMLAAGCIPVVNDTAEVRIDMDNNPFVRYARNYPEALASELEAIVTMADFETVSARAADSVQGSTWEDAGASVDAILRRTLAT